MLQATVPSIIEGFFLAKATPIFEAAAVSLAVRGRSNGSWDGLRWLCLLNEADPDEMTAALRELSETVFLRKPESGVHPDLPAYVAALLLWLSGQKSDEDAAVLIDPGIDLPLTYEKDYLPQPSRSIFPLERRHAEITLNDMELPLYGRVQRTKELWLDPTFDPPAAFAEEVRAAAAHIDVASLDRHCTRTIKDHGFEELKPVLARCAPDLLADLMRRKMQGVTTCPAESRYWSAIHATDHFLLAGEAEANAARTLRLSSKESSEDHESYAAGQLLMLELRNLDSQAQFDELIGADLKSIQPDFAEMLRPPTPDDVDALMSRYSSGSPKQQHDLIILLSFHSVEFSDATWSWLESVAKQTGHNLQGLVFHTLTRANPVRFGRMLAAEDWSWSPDAHFWVNHYGTGALIEATRSLPFDQMAPRLAPWRLLEAARMRGADPAEVRLAAEIFGHVLTAERIDAPDPGAILSVDRTEAKSSPFIFSVSPRPIQEDANDPMAALKAAIDVDAQIKAYRRAAETAASRIDKARKSGASLYLSDIKAGDLAPVLQHAPDMVDHWLEGSNELTADFRRRVCLAESAFMALCEVLLIHDPLRGTQLWRALRSTMRTLYIGAAGVEDLYHMVFRVPDSQSVAALREELVGLKWRHTDQELFDLAVGASYNGKTDWLDAVIESDRASNLVWKRKRGAVLAGFTANNTLPVAGAWPDGQIRTGHAELERKSEHFRWIEACAHHWWRVYLEAHDLTESYAAWVLFLCSADRRAWIWISEDVQAIDDNSTLFNLKMSHAYLNQSNLKQAMKKRTEKLKESFIDRKIWAGIGPWDKERDSVSFGIDQMKSDA
jgi:hypothetical protein